MTVCLFRIACWTPSYQVILYCCKIYVARVCMIVCKTIGSRNNAYTSESQMVITMQLMSLKSEPHTIHHKQRYCYFCHITCWWYINKELFPRIFYNHNPYTETKKLLLYICVQNATGDAPSIYKSMQGTCNEFHTCIYYLLLCNNNY